MDVALEEDQVLGELLETPLMLWIAMLAYQDAGVEPSSGDTLDQRRKRLFANFADAMFRRRAVDARYTSSQTLLWLSWLASAMTHSNQTVFYLEDLKGAWLRTRTQKVLSSVGVVVAVGLTIGLINGLIGGASRPSSSRPSADGCAPTSRWQ